MNFTKIESTKDYVLVYKNGVYRLHYYSDEDRCKAKDMKSLITKDYNKILKRIERNNENEV